MVSYTRALQFWAEKANLPSGGQPHLLAGSMIELWEEVKCYLSFSDEDVFWGGSSRGNPLHSTQGGHTPEHPASTPMKKATMEPTAKKRPPNQFPGWEKVLHPSRPIVTAGETLPLSRGTKQRPCSQSPGRGLVWQPQTKEQGVSTIQLKPPSPTSKPEVIW